MEWMTFVIFLCYRRLLPRLNRMTVLLTTALFLMELYSLRSLPSYLRFLFEVLFLFQSLSDAFYQEIYVLTNIVLFLLGMTLSVLNKRPVGDLLLSITLLPLSLFLLSKYRKGIGEGDSEFLCALGSLISYPELVSCFFLAVTILLLYSRIRKKESYPLLPFLFISYVILRVAL